MTSKAEEIAAEFDGHFKKIPINGLHEAVESDVLKVLHEYGAEVRKDAADLRSRK